jgi:hypothetical protein
MRYSLSSLKTAISQPRELVIELNRYAENGFSHRKDSCYNKNGFDILEEDWDNLAILDACRYDAFCDKGEQLPGELKKRESKAGATTEFLKHNFQSRNLKDTIYKTVNPQLYRNKEEIDVSFFQEYHVWMDNWSEDHRTVQPGVVTDKSLSVAEEYPNKRLIIHYLQPYAPYIGSTGEQFPSDYLNFWSSFTAGKFDLDLETAKQAYYENVEIVIPHVEQLLTELQGKTVVTADHAELLGERDRPISIRRYGHAGYTYIPELVEVPWLTYQNGNRKDIITEGKGTGEIGKRVTESTVKERLKDLGYVNEG